MKIAQYRFPSGTVHIDEATEFQEQYQGHVRVSEVTEVDFKARRVEEMVVKELAQLDLVQKTVEAEYATKISAIKNRRAELAALTYTPSYIDEHNGDGKVMQ